MFFHLDHRLGRVHYRIGSLERWRKFGKKHRKVHYRIGSLETVSDVKEIVVIGSLPNR